MPSNLHPKIKMEGEIILSGIELDCGALGVKRCDVTAHVNDVDEPLSVLVTAIKAKFNGSVLDIFDEVNADQIEMIKLIVRDYFNLKEASSQ